MYRHYLQQTGQKAVYHVVRAGIRFDPGGFRRCAERVLKKQKEEEEMLGKTQQMHKYPCRNSTDTRGHTDGQMNVKITDKDSDEEVLCRPVTNLKR